MEKKLIKKNFLRKIILTQIIILIFILNVNSEDNNEEDQLVIDVINEINEGEIISISVYTIENNTPKYQINTKISFNNKIYNTTFENPELIIQTPEVTEDTVFEITATKNGYKNANSYILVLNKNENKSQIFITILDNDFIIEGNTYFSVIITDEKGIPISDVKVAIQSYMGKDSISFTDENGRARILTPNNREEIIVIAQKNGYLNGTEKIWINIKPNLFEQIIKNPFFLTIIAFIILILSIVLVNIRREKNNYNHKYENNSKKIENKKNESISKNSNQNNTESKFKNKIKSIKDSKIEEIWITKKTENKIIKPIRKNNIYKKYSNNLNKNNKKENFIEGLDDIRNKIDKLITTNYEEKEKKWFEGKSNIKLKIDEKLKKKNKTN
jgi:hypothetical protein